MSREVKCPQCGGNKAKEIGDGYKCLYCGTTFRNETFDESEEPVYKEPMVLQNPTNPLSNVNVTVNVPGGGYSNNEPRRHSENNFSKGAAQGAGAVAGGCLTTTAIMIAIPFILFLALLSMCS